MSEMGHKKAKLTKVLDGYYVPVNIALWLESEYSVYSDQELTQEDAYFVLKGFFEEQDWQCTYFLFDDELYQITEERDLDEYGYVEAELNQDQSISLDAFWYNGGGSWFEMVEEGLKKLEGEYR